LLGTGEKEITKKEKAELQCTGRQLPRVKETGRPALLAGS